MDNQELALVKSESVKMIISSTPQAYNDNLTSHDRCIDFGQRLLESINDSGMTDDLDQQAAAFIEKARRTVAKMNERRSPLTKLFDNIRREFTVLENDIDPTKSGTVAFQLQQQRNAYASAKRQEAERRQREALRRQQQQQAREQYRIDLEDDYRRQLNALLDKQVADLMQLSATLTLDNYDDNLRRLKEAPCQMPANLVLQPTISRPYVLSADEAHDIARLVWADILPSLLDQYRTEMESNRDTLLDMLPGKRAELERAAQASQAEAERIRREMVEREAAEAARKEAERREREEKERKQTELRKAQAEMGGLFDQQAAMAPTYQPRASVKKKLIPLNPEAFADIFMFWWVNEGQNLSVEELSKTLKKMLAFAEKAANDKTNPVTIKSEHICYEDEVKAK